MIHAFCGIDWIRYYLVYVIMFTFKYLTVFCLYKLNQAKKKGQTKKNDYQNEAY